MKRPDQAREVQLLKSARMRLETVLPDFKGNWLLVDVDRQRLLHLDSEEIIGEFRVSTARNGINALQDSYGTPPGVHRIGRKIGDGLALGTRFESREPLPGTWTPAQGKSDPADAPDLILSRILTLEGCETGVNLGPGRDSESRYIYIHGTNHEGEIGQPVSHGCIRLRNADIVSLYETVTEGDPVVIV